MPGRVDRLSVVLELARRVTARRHLDDVLAETLSCLRPLVAFSGGSIQLLDEEGWIRLAAADPPAPEHVLAMRIPLGSTVGGRVILTEQPVYLADVLADVAVPPERRKGPNLSRGVRSYLGVPLVADGRAIGLLQLDAAEPDAWDEDERLLLVSVAPIVAAAIQNARAYELRGKAFARLAAWEDQRSRAHALLEEQVLPAVADLGHEVTTVAQARDPQALPERLRRCLDDLERLSAALAGMAPLVGDEPPVAASDDEADEPPQLARHAG